jgi:hypothetical protein
MATNRGIYKKLHKWPGLIISFVLLYYGITGVFMNHRELISGLDVNPDLLPANYSYKNWNNAALKGNIIINKDSILVYGNIGIWLTDSDYTRYSSFNTGLPKGSDNRKIFDIHRSSNGDLYAATLFGLYGYNYQTESWQRFGINAGIKRFTAIESVNDTLYVINRSHLYIGLSQGINTVFNKIELPEPEGYENKVTLFETLWQFHSGEIFGLPGKLFVDLLGLTTVFLSVTGIIYFFFPGWIKRRSRKEKPSYKLIRINRWSLKWHNRVGEWAFLFLVLLFFTGMFLRPPLLIAIANAKTAPLKFSHLDQPNPWYDKLRDIIYDPRSGKLLLSTSEGMFHMDKNVLRPVKYLIQPPVSVMGINSFTLFGEDSFLTGSFTGLFLWNPSDPGIINYVTGEPYMDDAGGRPVGDLKITGTFYGTDGNLYIIDYDHGVLPVFHETTFPEMPHNILEESKLSLWNVALEIHTGRIFQNLMGDFYILIVPLAGLTGVIVVISGYLLWRKRYRNRKIV